MAQIVALGTLIGAKIAAAGAVAGAAAAAHPILFGIAAAGAVAGGVSKINAGIQQQHALGLRAAQTGLQLQAEQTQAAIENENRQRRLQVVLATQQAIFGNSNVSLSDGTPSIIAGDTITQSQRLDQQASLLSRTRQAVLQADMIGQQQAGRIAFRQGLVGAAGSLVQFGTSVARIGSFSGGSTGGGSGGLSGLTGDFSGMGGLA